MLWGLVPIAICISYCWPVLQSYIPFWQTSGPDKRDRAIRETSLRLVHVGAARACAYISMLYVSFTLPKCWVIRRRAQSVNLLTRRRMITNATSSVGAWRPLSGTSIIEAETLLVFNSCSMGSNRLDACLSYPVPLCGGGYSCSNLLCCVMAAMMPVYSHCHADSTDRKERMNRIRVM